MPNMLPMDLVTRLTRPLVSRTTLSTVVTTTSPMSAMSRPICFRTLFTASAAMEMTLSTKAFIFGPKTAPKLTSMKLMISKTASNTVSFIRAQISDEA